jgi:hypothetical protein
MFSAVFNGGNGGFGETQLIQGHARCRVHECRADQIVDLTGRFLGRKPGRSDIGYAVPARIQRADPRSPGDIGAERVGGRKPRAFAQENYGQLGVHQLADLVADRDSPLLDEDDGPDGQTPSAKKGTEAIEHGQKVEADRYG